MCTKIVPHGISPLFSFGHSILPKKLFAVSEAIAYSKKEHSTLISITDAYYGITNSLTGIISIPIVSQTPVINKGDKTGLGDIFFHANYLLHSEKSDEHSYRIIGSAGIRIPTTTIAERTFLTLKTTSFFLGITQDSLTKHWYIYYDFGTVLPIKSNHIKFGNILINNIGIGKVFCFGEKYLIIFAEMGNVYARPTKFNNKPILTTGGNSLFLGPSLRFQFKNYLIQGGIQHVVSRSLRAERSINESDYVAAFFVACAF